MTDEPPQEVRELYAYVAVNPDGGEEGVIRRDTPIGTQPMIADSVARLLQFKEIAIGVCEQNGWRLRMVGYRRSMAEDVE